MTYTEFVSQCRIRHIPASKKDGKKAVEEIFYISAPHWPSHMHVPVLNTSAKEWELQRMYQTHLTMTAQAA